MTWAMKCFCGIAILAACASSAQAAEITFDLAWSGAHFGNTAAATGQITFESNLLPNPGAWYGPTFPMVVGLTITVTGAPAGNGTFMRADFSQVLWMTGGATLDLTRELVGQPTPSGYNWGFLGQGGNFNLYGVAGAPSGVAPFILGAGGSWSPSNLMALTSFAPAGSAVPEPGTLGVAGLSLIAVITFFRRRSA